MRRGPQEEHDRERQRQGLERVRRDRGRTGEHGKAAGKAADHDVPPGTPLQPDRVDDGVREGTEERIDGGRRIERHRGEPDTGCAGCRDRDVPGGASRKLAGHEGAIARAPHPRVELALRGLVESARGGRSHRDGQPQRTHLPGRQRSPGCDRQSRDRRKSDHQTDPQLEQLKDQAQVQGARRPQQNRCLIALRHVRLSPGSIL